VQHEGQWGKGGDEIYEVEVDNRYQTEAHHSVQLTIFWELKNEYLMLTNIKWKDSKRWASIKFELSEQYNFYYI
jgi:hypothetical protein